MLMVCNQYTEARSFSGGMGGGHASSTLQVPLSQHMERTSPTYKLTFPDFSTRLIYKNLIYLYFPGFSWQRCSVVNPETHGASVGDVVNNETIWRIHYVALTSTL